MNKYLLLRDNKQTGPYSAEELVKKGLKAYDLVWLEGKSAAWRYPSEMEELSPFAPIVEEQPYDRFFKKSNSAQEQAIQSAQQQLKSQVKVPVTTELNQANDISFQQQAAGISSQQIAANHSTQVQSISNTQAESAAQYSRQTEQVVKTGSGKVYVTLPAGMNQQTSTVQTTPQSSAKSGQTVVQQQQGISPQASIQPPTTNEINNESLAVPEEAAKALEDRAAALAKFVQQAAAAREDKSAKAGQNNQAADHSGPGQQSGKGTGKIGQANAAREYADQKKAEKAAQAQPNEEKKAQHSSCKTQQPVFSSLIAATNHDTEEKVPVIPMRKRDKRRLAVRSIVAVCLLLGGIAIGMALTYSKQSSQNQAAPDELVERLQTREAQKQETAPADQSPVNTITEPQTDYAEEAGPRPANEHSAIPAGTRPLAEKQLAVKNGPASSTVKDEPAVSFVEKEPAQASHAVISSEETPKPVPRQDLSAAREKIYQMVKVDASTFRTGVLGGISDLHFTISNNSSFPLDQIELEVKYLGPENRVVKVQRLLFNDIAAGSEKTLEAPRTARGVSIDYAVTKIHSRALGIARAGM